MGAPLRPLHASGEREQTRTCPYLSANGCNPTASWSLLNVAVLVELRHIGPQVADLFFALYAGEYHLGARNLGAGILDVFLEHGLAPGDSGTLVGVTVVETID